MRTRFRFLLGAMLCCAAAAAAAAPPEDGLPFRLGEGKAFDPRMETIRGVAFDAADNLLVAGAAGVRVFSPAGVLMRDLKTSGAATCVAVSPDGLVYAGTRNSISKFQSDGVRVAVWGKAGREPGELGFLTAVAASREFLYAADAGNRRILRFAADGDFVDEIDGFLIPSPYFDCALDTSGTLFAAHTGKHRLERYDGNRRVESSWGVFGTAPDKFSGCCNPTNFALFRDGRVATSEKGIPRLKVHTPEGKLLAHLGSAAFPDGVAGMDLAIDSRDRLALADPVAGRIRFFELVPR